MGGAQPLIETLGERGKAHLDPVALMGEEARIARGEIPRRSSGGSGRRRCEEEEHERKEILRSHNHEQSVIANVQR